MDFNFKLSQDKSNVLVEALNTDIRVRTALIVELNQQANDQFQAAQKAQKGNVAVAQAEPEGKSQEAVAQAQVTKKAYTGKPRGPKKKIKVAEAVTVQ